MLFRSRTFASTVPIINMVNLYFQPDAQLTVQDRMVLDVLQKDYDRFQEKSTAAQVGASQVDSAAPKGNRIGDEHIICPVF